jgi:FHA domain
MNTALTDLSVSLSDTEGGVHSLRSEKPFRIGRDFSNDLSISDASVSRHHAFIAIADGRARLQDLGSSNGTYVNNLRVTQTFLRDDDSLRFGHVCFIFHIAANPNSKATNVRETLFSKKGGVAGWWQRLESVIRYPVQPVARPEVRVPASPDVFRVLGRCSRTRLPFLVKLQQTGKARYLVRTVIPIDEARTRNESFRARKIEGNLLRSREFAGCPHCKSRGNLNICACCDNGLACSGRNWPSKIFRLQMCPWCHSVVYSTKKWRGLITGGGD